MFNEITKRAVLEALEHPTQINQAVVDAQQARRILDRLVGYRLSPLLWDKIRRGLSAGRVQSVALRIVCDREKEIESFVAREYWVVSAQLEGAEPPPFVARLKRKGREEIELGSGDEVKALRADLEGVPWRVASVETKERKRTPPPPYTTSKFQQEASRRLRMPVRKAMQVAQALYEGKEIGSRGAVGLITYMRTDSTRVSDAALAEARQAIEREHGAEYLPEKAIHYRSKKGAQDAHEAIRPTCLDLPPATVKGWLSKDELAVYRLIWNRFVASQMKPALFDETIVEVEAAGWIFEARGSVVKFPGFLALYHEATDEDAPEEEQPAHFPRLEVGQALRLLELTDEQKFTQPPPRYTEATLVKALEENGIGRPSTYAQILQTLRSREYTTVEETRFRPTELGRRVSDQLVRSFDDIMAVGYTAGLERDLDEVEEGRQDWVKLLKGFWHKFVVDLERARREMPALKEGEPTDQVCEACGKPLLRKWGRFGTFLACSGYPECRNTKDESAREVPEIDADCPNCGKKLALRRGRFGEFLACPDYPKCKGTARLRKKADGTYEVLQDRRLDERCPECGSQLVERDGRFGMFVSCSGYPRCAWIKQEKVGIACPQEGCRGELVVKRSRRSKGFYGCDRYPECDFVVWDLPVATPCPACGSPFVVEKETKKHGTFRYCWRETCEWTDAAEGVPRPRKASASSPARTRATAARKRKVAARQKAAAGVKTTATRAGARKKKAEKGASAQGS
jgi:DNA topoisomerase-1